MTFYANKFGYFETNDQNWLKNRESQKPIKDIDFVAQLTLIN